MAGLSLETLSIIAGTLDELRATRPALMLRMWHHLDADPERELMFEAVGGDGDPSFVDGFLLATRQRLAGRWPRLRGSARLCGDHAPRLEDAFRRALADVLGPRANPLLLNAWSLLLRDFLAELCSQQAAKR